MIEKAFKIYRTGKTVLSEGGFNLRNGTQILLSYCEEIRLLSQFLETDQLNPRIIQLQLMKRKSPIQSQLLEIVNLQSF